MEQGLETGHRHMPRGVAQANVRLTDISSVRCNQKVLGQGMHKGIQALDTHGEDRENLTNDQETR
jgi:hypothetical protein